MIPVHDAAGRLFLLRLSISPAAFSLKDLHPTIHTYPHLTAFYTYCQTIILAFNTITRSRCHY